MSDSQIGCGVKSTPSPSLRNHMVPRVSNDQNYSVEHCGSNIITISGETMKAHSKKEIGTKLDNHEADLPSCEE